MGASINTSNWSTTPDGLTDALQVPGTVTDVYFTAANATGVAGSLTTTLDNAFSVAGLFFSVSSGSITSVTVNTGSNLLTLGGDGLTLATSNASGTISGSGAILLNGYQNWANNANNRALTVTVPISASTYTTLSLDGTGSGGVVLSGVISNGPGTLSLSLAQSGTTLLGGSIANSYSGGTTISAGTVKLGGSGGAGQHRRTAHHQRRRAGPQRLFADGRHVFRRWRNDPQQQPIGRSHAHRGPGEQQLYQLQRHDRRQRRGPSRRVRRLEHHRQRRADALRHEHV